MVEDSIFLPRFAAGDVAQLRVRIAVADDTGAGSYPAVLEGEYRDPDGIILSTRPVPLGIQVSRGAVLNVLARDLSIGPNGEETITAFFSKTGDTPAYDARARIIGSYVIQTVADSAQLGILKPGETKTASFVISAKAALAGKEYVLDSGIKYRDELGAPMLSDTMSFGVDVVQPAGVSAVSSDPVAIIVIIGAIVLIVIVAWKLRERRKT